jgi:YihY family inner membrane protein
MVLLRRSGERPTKGVGPVSLTERLDAFQQRHHWAGFPLAVLYKFFDDQGGYLAALITYYGFLSVFPLLLLLSSVLGFLLQGDPHLQQEILTSALRKFPVIGEQLGDPKGLRGSSLAIVIGLVGSLYGALGVAQATQNAMNTMWAVPRNRRPNPIASRVRSLALLAIGGLTFLLTAVLSGLGSNGYGLSVGPMIRSAASLVATVLTAAYFVFLFRLATTRGLTRRQVLPGAIAAAVVWQILQTFGTEYVGGVVKNADATNGVFAIVLGLIAWIYLATVSLLLCVQSNVVRVRKLYPRTLLTPFTDDVDLTDADRRAYSSYARAQRSKDFQSVEVRFENDGQNATARRNLRQTDEASEDDARDDVARQRADEAERLADRPQNDREQDDRPQNEPG